MRPILAALFAWLLLIPVAHALESPSGRVLLTVTGTPWHDGAVHFTGPLGRDLLSAVDAQGSTLRITALNDYSASMPVADLHDHGVILAMTLDGETLRVRDHGSIFVIYPFDDSPQLLNGEVLMRSVWQVHRIDVVGD